MKIIKLESINRNLLIVSPFNIRKGKYKVSGENCKSTEWKEDLNKIKGSSLEFDALKRSILKKGLISPLYVVKDSKSGQYLVYRGQRRLIALNELIAEGKIIEQKITCIVKKSKDEFDQIEEQVMDIELKKAIESNDSGFAALELVDKYGSIEKAELALGLDADWLGYHIQHLSLNPPAHLTETEQTSLKKKCVEVLGDSKENSEESHEQPRVSTSPSIVITTEQRPYFREWEREFSQMNQLTLTGAFQEWWKKSRPYMIRLNVDLISALLEKSKDQKLPPRRILERETNKLIRELLENESYIVKKEEENEEKEFDNETGEWK